MRTAPAALASVTRSCSVRPTGGRTTGINVGRAIRRAAEKAKLNPAGAKRVSPHDLRHSCAALLLAAGVPAPKVAAVLRHADPRVTLAIYGGLVETQRSELLADVEAALR